MHSAAVYFALMASSVVGLKINLQRFSEPNCPSEFHNNSSGQHDMYMESNKGCKKFSPQIPFESYIADVVKGSDQMADDYCHVDTFESGDCTGPAFTIGDLQCTGSMCGTPNPNGSYHGNSAKLICEKRTLSTTPSVTTSQLSCHATSPVRMSSSKSSTHVLPSKSSTRVSSSKSSIGVKSSTSCTSTHVKTVTASSISLTPVEPITIRGSTLFTSVVRVSPTTITGAALCNMAPAVTASVKSAASASAAAMMLARRSISAVASPSLGQASDDDADEDVDEDANSAVEEEAKILIFAEIMEKLQGDCGDDDDDDAA